MGRLPIFDRHSGDYLVELAQGAARRARMRGAPHPRPCQGGGARAWGSPSRPDPRPVPPAPRTPADQRAGPPIADTRGLDRFKRAFDDGRVRRSDLGYRRLYSRCWTAHLHGDLPALLELAADPSLTPDMLATIAPDAADRGAPSELVRAALAHPACTPGVAGRYATHRDAAVRLRVARFPGLLTSSLAILAIDQDETVRAAAVRVLDERAGTMTGD